MDILSELLLLIVLDLGLSSHSSHFRTFTMSSSVQPDFNLTFIFSSEKIQVITSWTLGC